MASDDNVVRLKHLQPLANGISIPNGDNVVKLKHLVSLASAIADEAPSQQPVLTLGSWSAADSIYSAEIFYDGDGTISTDIGSISNGVLCVEDEDGCFSGTLTISTNSNFNGPIPALIDSFSITPNEITVGTGTSTTAEIQITTSPGNIPYQISIPDAPDWISIDDTTIIFAPPDSVTLGNYVFTVVATTKDDRKEYAVNVNVTATKETELTVSSGDYDYNWYDYTIIKDYKLIFDGELNGRTVTVSGGQLPLYWTASKLKTKEFKRTGTPSYNQTTNKTTFVVRQFCTFSEKITTPKTSTKSGTLYFKVSANQEYKESRTVGCDFSNAYAISSVPTTILGE